MKSSLWGILFWLLSPSWLLAQEADLRLSKSADPLLVNLGATVTWTLLAENLGPDSPNMVSIQDTLPDGIELLELDSRCEVNQQNSSLVECLLPLANGEMQTLAIRARVALPPVNGTQVVNSAIIADATGETSDPLTSNNTATASSDYTEGPLPLDLLISEVIQVQDLETVVPPANIVVNENILVSDDSNIIGSLALLIEENIQVADTAIPAPALSILVTEPVSVSDSVALNPTLLISVTENILLADSATPAPSLQIHVLESITVSESLVTTVPMDILVVENIAVVDRIITSAPMPELIFSSGFESCTEGSTLPSCLQP